GWLLAVILAGVPTLIVAALIVRSALKFAVEEHFSVRRSPQEVFRFIATDYFHNRPRWTRAGADSARLVTLEQTSPGPVGAGTTGHEVAERNGQQAVWMLVVTAYEPDRRFAVETQAGNTGAIIRYTFTPLATGTEVTLRYEMRYNGPARRWQWF